MTTRHDVEEDACGRAALYGLVALRRGRPRPGRYELSPKAAFIHNFVKFTVSPRDLLPPSAPLAVCVLGDASFGDVLGGYVKGHKIDGHEIAVSLVASEAAAAYAGARLSAVAETGAPSMIDVGVRQVAERRQPA